MKRPSSKLTEKQLTLISAGAGVLVLAGICGAIFWAVSTAGTLDAEIRQLDDKRSELDRKERNLPRLEREIASLQVEVERSVQKLPNEQEIADLIKNLGSIRAGTDENGITIKIKKFQPEQDKRLAGLVPEEDAGQRFTPHPYVVEAEGNFYHFGRFINLLENHLRFIKVESYDMSNPGKKGWDRSGKDITIKIITYTYNPGQGEQVERGDRPSIDWQDAMEEAFVFERRNRRDPFKIPLKSISASDFDRRPKLTEGQQQDLVAKAERLLKKLEHCIKTRQVDDALEYFLDIEQIKSQRFTVPSYYQRVQKIYFAAVDLTEEIQDHAARQAVHRAHNMLADMRRAFEAGDHRRLKAIREQMRGLLNVETQDPELRAKLDRCRKEADTLRRCSEIRIEFFQTDIRVTGTYGGSLRNTVIFNGGKYGEEGMEVEIGGLKFLVKKIDARKSTVIIVYKGEEIKLTQGEDRRSLRQQPSEGLDREEGTTPGAETEAGERKEEHTDEGEGGNGAPPPLQS